MTSSFVFVLEGSDGRYVANARPLAWTQMFAAAAIFESAEEADTAKDVAEDSSHVRITILKVNRP